VKIVVGTISLDVQEGWELYLQETSGMIHEAPEKAGK